MRKIDYLILVGTLILSILWAEFQPFRIKNWSDSVYIILAIPLVIIFWEIFKKVSSDRIKH